MPKVVPVRGQYQRLLALTFGTARLRGIPPYLATGSVSAGGVSHFLGNETV